MKADDLDIVLGGAGILVLGLLGALIVSGLGAWLIARFLFRRL